jgi:catechol 2,3-dioxygenase-like lactoylglutathione lyase family enzyme
MTMRIGKAGVDIGIVVRDLDAMLAFYQDVLGCYHEGHNPVPDGGVMHRLWAAETMIKLVAPGTVPAAANPPGGMRGATGLRYLTFTITNLDEVHDACVGAGAPVVLAPFSYMPGVRIAMYEDPDGNHVEFLERAG